jgi:hypothetical protein
MIELQQYLCEAKIDPELKAISGKLMANAIHGKVSVADPNLFDEIKGKFEQKQTEEKLGRTVFVRNSSTYELIMVNPNHCLWKIPTDKELFGKTEKNMEKELRNSIDSFNWGDHFGPFIYESQMYFIYKYFKKVQDGTISKGWHRFILSMRDSYDIILVNFDKREWKYDSSTDDAYLVWRTGSMLKSWYDWYQKHDSDYYDTYVRPERRFMDYLSNVFTKVAFDENDGKEWFKGHRGFETCMYCMDDMTCRDIHWTDIKSEQDLLQEIKDLEKTQKKYPGYPDSVSKELYDYIKKNFTNAGYQREGKGWQKVSIKGCDSKFSRFMLNTRKRQYGDVTMDEFYGGGIVD